jgi:hypothetical protein
VRTRSKLMNRMAIGYIDRDDTAIGIMEWELGSRVVGEMLPENEPILNLPVLKTRIAQAIGDTPVNTYFKTTYEECESYVDMFVALEHETEEVYLCEGIYTGKDGHEYPKLELLQVHPECEENKKDWIVDVDLVEFAAEDFDELVYIRTRPKTELKEDEHGVYINTSGMD